MNKRIWLFPLMLALFFSLGGCADTSVRDARWKLEAQQKAEANALVSPEQAKQMHGELPANYEKMIKEYMEDSLIDPTSALYKFQPIAPRKTGWYVSFRLNAKNRMGGYTGGKPYGCRISQGKVIQCGECGYDLGGSIGYVPYEDCKNLWPALNANQ